MMTIEEFCNVHRACAEGRRWAVDHCKTMNGAWKTACPLWVVWIATRPGVLPDRELRLFAVRCARYVQHLITNSRSIAAIDVAERYALGEATNAELLVARATARAAAEAAARAAAWESDWEAAGAADWAAAGAAVMKAANAAETAFEAAVSASYWAGGIAAEIMASQVLVSDLHKLTPNFNC